MYYHRMKKVLANIRKEKENHAWMIQILIQEMDIMKQINQYYTTFEVICHLKRRTEKELMLTLK